MCLDNSGTAKKNEVLRFKPQVNENPAVSDYGSGNAESA